MFSAVYVFLPVVVRSHTSARGRIRRAGGDVLADQFLAAAVIDRGVDEVDPFVEHRVEQG
jgi:hypothetical protein